MLILSWTYEVFKSFFFLRDEKGRLAVFGMVDEWKYLLCIETLMNNSTFTFFLFHSFLLSKRWH